MATASEQVIMARLEVLEAWKQSNKLLTSDGSSERNLAKTSLDMEIYVATLINDPPMQARNIQAIVEAKIKNDVEELIDAKLRTTLQFAKVNHRDDGKQLWFNSVLESKAVQEVGLVVDAKQYRQWSKRMKNALDQIRPNSRAALVHVEKWTEEELNDAIRQGSFDTR